MIRTLYVRLAITFIGVVLTSLIISFFISSSLYRQEISGRIDQYIIRQGKEIIALYQQNPTKGIDAYLNRLPLGYNAWLYKETGEVQYYSTTPRKPKRGISEQDVKHVLKGGIYRDVDDPGPPFSRIVGLPFQMNNQHYALFIRLRVDEIFTDLHKVLRTVLFIVFIVGSLQYLIVARYLVKPIRAMTLATRKLAQGDFDVHVDVKQKDELGTLAKSFCQKH
ncbi:HAMP domain-containing protein [Thermoflavimicrobium dichotomicum]|uniref:histidine kinase n=1 Tax=Thermoflavimicrobium dichotomicum TaxID=46223 RepID=A0A1I3TMP0_9BACL|nr:HAMP domain-containing protein [Thermoflavimicrobium dichotomicum]SFJ71822.1 HAMP domain-containing protein [Thermoflavimicrobium dichotomicum]